MAPLKASEIALLLKSRKPLDARSKDFTGGDLSHADLSGADLRQAIFKNAKLNGANLSGADLRGAVMTGANLSQTNCTGADLRTTWSGVNLTGANLTNAQMIQVKMVKTNLTNTILTGVDMRLADLTDAIVTDKQLAKAKNIDGLIHPHGKPLPIYKVHDYHKDWVAAKKAYDSKLFDQKLGAKLDELNTLYTQMLKASDKARPALVVKYQAKAKVVATIVGDYRTIVGGQPNHAKALDVLKNIDDKYTGMLTVIQRDIDKAF